ncbi:hypothetical protein KEM52_003466 [Ascosphaera acerosa]|nr:hypothetical protein KEM52_003466 [Ascosphaera acerosa]
MHKVMAHHVHLSGRFLCLALENAPSVTFAVQLLAQSQLPERQKRALLLLLPPGDLNAALGTVPRSVLYAFVSLLCRFADLRSTDAAENDVDMRVKQAWSYVSATEGIRHDMTITPRLSASERQRLTLQDIESRVDSSLTFAHALQLIRASATTYPPISHRVLKTMAIDKFDPETQRFPLSYQRVANLWDVMEYLEYMRSVHASVDIAALENVCSCLDRLLIIARLNSLGVNRGIHLTRYVRAQLRRGRPYHEYISVNGLISSSIDAVKRCFDALMLPGARAFELRAQVSPSPSHHIQVSNVVSALPLMVQVPTPHLIHMMCRTFGLAGDIQGLLLLASWMRKFEPEVASAVDERIGGARQMRHAVCAIRLFTAGEEEDARSRWEAWDPVLADRWALGSRIAEAREMEAAARREIRQIVEDTPLLAPWPDDSEMETYITREQAR